MGGWIAAWFALKYPNKIEKLVLLDAAGYAPPKDFDVKIFDGLNPFQRGSYDIFGR